MLCPTLVVDEAERDLFWKLFAALRHYRKELSLAGGALPKFTEPFHRNLCNLRYLRIAIWSANSDMEDVLRVCNGNLKSLHLYGNFLHKRHVDAIASHCVGLETLNYGII